MDRFPEAGRPLHRRLLMIIHGSLLLLILFVTPRAYAVNEINVVGLFKNRAVVVVDGVQRILIPGKPSPEGITLISANSREAVLEVNGKRHTYNLGNHISNRYQKPTGQKTVTIAPDGTGMYVTDGSINDFQVSFIVDTGSSFISMNKLQAQRLGLDYKTTGKQSFSSTASGMDKIYLVKLDRVQVGGIKVNDVQGAVHDGDFPKEILLGNSFLSKITMKREGRLLKLEQSY